jgi:hypothetical protein
MKMVQADMETEEMVEINLMVPVKLFGWGMILFPPWNNLVQS